MTFRVFDDDRVREWNIKTVLDNGRAYEHVVIVLHETEQNPFEFGLAHLTVSHSDANIRQQFLNHRGAHEDRVDAVMNKVHLAAAAQLLVNGRFDQLLIEMRDDGMN